MIPASLAKSIKAFIKKRLRELKNTSDKNWLASTSPLNASDYADLESVMRSMAKRLGYGVLAGDKLDVAMWVNDDSYTLLAKTKAAFRSLPVLGRLDRIIREHVLKKDLQVYCGRSMNTFKLIKERVLVTHRTEMPLSTTSNIHVARQFAKQKGLIVRIDLKAGQAALDVNQFMGNLVSDGDMLPREDEIILPARGSLLIKDYTFDPILKDIIVICSFVERKKIKLPLSLRRRAYFARRAVAARRLALVQARKERNKAALEDLKSKLKKAEARLASVERYEKFAQAAKQAVTKAPAAANNNGAKK